MLIVTLGKADFSGFALCLYYSSILEHVNKTDGFRPHFSNSLPAVLQNKSQVESGLRPSPAGDRSTFW